MTMRLTTHIVLIFMLPSLLLLLISVNYRLNLIDFRDESRSGVYRHDPFLLFPITAIPLPITASFLSCVETPIDMSTALPPHPPLTCHLRQAGVYDHEISTVRLDENLHPTEPLHPDVLRGEDPISFIFGGIIHVWTKYNGRFRLYRTTTIGEVSSWMTYPSNSTTFHDRTDLDTFLDRNDDLPLSSSSLMNDTLLPSSLSSLFFKKKRRNITPIVIDERHILFVDFDAEELQMCFFPHSVIPPLLCVPSAATFQYQGGKRRMGVHQGGTAGRVIGQEMANSFLRVPYESDSVHVGFGRVGQNGPIFGWVLRHSWPGEYLHFTVGIDYLDLALDTVIADPTSLVPLGGMWYMFTSNGGVRTVPLPYLRHLVKDFFV